MICELIYSHAYIYTYIHTYIHTCVCVFVCLTHPFEKIDVSRIFHFDIFSNGVNIPSSDSKLAVNVSVY